MAKGNHIMRKTIFIAFVAIATIAAMASCNTDPIHGTAPVTRAFFTDEEGKSNFPLEEFHQYGQEGDTLNQRKLVNKYRKTLTANVVRKYSEYSLTPENIKFVLGSGFAKNVQSGDGKTYNGKFRNELIIIIDSDTVKDTVFLACGNGMLSPLRLKSQSNFGTAEQWRFTIKKGEGLATYLPDLKEWGKTAEDLGIMILDEQGNQVTSETYMTHLGKWRSLLFEGDVIDLIAGKVYNENGQQVDFARRKAESVKENARRAREAKKKRRR